MGNKLSVYNVLYDYLKITHQEEATKRDKGVYYSVFKKAFDSGYDVSTVYRLIRQHYSANTPTALIEVFKQATNPRRNLIKNSSELAVHNELRITTGPPVISYDYNTGEYLRTIEPFFLEPRASYTMDDLMAYYKSKAKLYSPVIMSDNRILGTLKWLEGQHGLEMTLFLIDAAAIKLDESDIDFTNPSNLSDYYLQAKEYLSKKRSDCKETGGDVIVPKRREL